MVETVRVGEEGPSNPAFAIGCPVSCVVPSPGVGLVAAGLSPPATNNSPSTVTAAAPASASGRLPTIDAVCRAGSTAWMTLTGVPACGPVMASPPNA